MQDSTDRLSETPWTNRPAEERGLLNPPFCASLLWCAAYDYEAEDAGALSFEESFLVLPFVLHRGTREALPRSTRTSLAVWLEENPLSRSQIARRAQMMVPFTKEGLLFGGIHEFIRIESGKVHAESDWRTAVNRVSKETSDEVRLCGKRAGFIGKWFAQTGNAATVLALIGLRP